MSARCITSVLIGYHVAELAVIRLGRQNREGRVGGGWGAVASQKLLASGNHGDRQDWLGHGVTPTIPIIFRCYSDYKYTHTTGGPYMHTKELHYTYTLESRMLAEWNRK